MRKVISKDGTPIAFDQSGQGPVLILVAGATATRLSAESLAATLASSFTVFAYDRRGRGDSGDTLPYAVEREVEDIDALITAAGGSAFVFGHSSGAILSLEYARMRPLNVTKLALYEPPLIIDDSRPPSPEDYLPHIIELISLGQRGDAVEYFMIEGVGIPRETVVQMQQSPVWPELEKIAHTLVYDGTIVDDAIHGDPFPLRKWASVTIPTLVMDGEISPMFMHTGSQELVRILPHAQHRRLPGQEHRPADNILAPALQEFFIG